MIKVTKTLIHLIHFYFQRKEILSKIGTKRKAFQKKKDEMIERLKKSGDGQLLSKEREGILKLSVPDLVDKLRTGQLDPVTVLEAYQAKALISTEETNCVVDFFDDGLKNAVMLRTVPEDKRGPFHGLPISVKECYFVKGYPCTNGMAKWIGRVSEEDGSLIKMMREMGAVPFCLTNIPQTMWSYGCSNPVYGPTLHPKDKLRTPGGSSGGEGCLIAQGGSPLGLGTDVGGSLRIPAHFCGIASLKPTYGRICESGRVKGIVPGITSNAGFMCKTVDGIVLGMKSLLEHPFLMSDLDSSVSPIKWRGDLFNPIRKLKIGWYDNFEFFPAVFGCQRAVRLASEMLRSKGFEVVHFQPPDLDEVFMDFFRFMLADSGKNSLEVWKGEILDQSIEVNNFVYQLPDMLRKKIFGKMIGLVSSSMGKISPLGLSFSGDLWNGLKAAEDRKVKILQKMKSLGIDVIIAPGFTFPAPPKNDPARLLPAVGITAVYNVLNFPVGSVPLDVYTKQDEMNMNDYPNSDFLFKIVKWGQQGAAGMPLNVQVIGKPWEEESVLRIMKELEESANFEKKYH